MQAPRNTATRPLLVRLRHPELALFNNVSAQFLKKGFIARAGQVIDATLVPAPKQYNSRGEKALIEQGAMPADGKPAKRRQKDIDAEVRADSPVLFARWFSAPELLRFLAGESLQDLLGRTAERAVDAAHAVAPTRSHSDPAGGASAEPSHRR